MCIRFELLIGFSFLLENKKLKHIKKINRPLKALNLKSIIKT